MVYFPHAFVDVTRPHINAITVTVNFALRFFFLVLYNICTVFVQHSYTFGVAVMQTIN